MPSKFCVFKLFSSRNIIKGTDIYKSRICEFCRSYADTSKAADSSSKQVMVQGTADDAVMRVRRARPADIPRVIRFVKDNARLAWPGLINQTSPNNLVMADFVTRTLAQGHSMLAEQQEVKRGWSQIRGIALNTSVCPWDATLLEKWAKCVRCNSSKKMMMFTAHCLRTPDLHDKYRVQNILQVILLVPPEAPRSAELVQMLARNSMYRGRDLGYPVLRFDVTDDPTAQVLENLKLKKEYQFSYEVFPTDIKIFDLDLNKDEKTDKKQEFKGKSITVYTAFPRDEN